MNFQHDMTAEEVTMRFGRWARDGYRVLVMEPKKLLRVKERGSELILAVELDNNIWEFSLGELPEVTPVHRCSTTPQGRLVYRVHIWDNCQRTRWRVTFRGVAEPEDMKLLQQVVEFYDKIPMGLTPEDFDELPPRPWEVQTPD